MIHLHINAFYLVSDEFFIYYLFNYLNFAINKILIDYYRMNTFTLSIYAIVNLLFLLNFE